MNRWWDDRPPWAEDPNLWAGACEEVAALLGEVGPISDLLRVPPGSVSVLGRTPEGRLVYSVLLPASGDEGRPVVAGGLSAYLSVVARDLVVEAPPPPPLDTVWD